MRFLGRRLAHAVLLLLAISFLSFALLQLTPGDFFDGLRLNPEISPQTVEGLRAQYGLDRPLPVRYERWLAALLHGQLGFSLAYKSPVGPLRLDLGFPNDPPPGDPFWQVHVSIGQAF